LYAELADPMDSLDDKIKAIVRSKTFPVTGKKGLTSISIDKSLRKVNTW
jgi:hypothetical protein